MYTPNRKIVPFDKVNIGDEVLNYEDEELVGEIKWKGNNLELQRSTYNILLQSSVDHEDPKYIKEELENLSEYDWVIINDPMYGDTLYNYNCDPSGVIIMEEQPSPEEDDDKIVSLGNYRKDNSIEELLMYQNQKTNKVAYLVRVSNYIDINHLPGLRLDYKLINMPIAIFSNESDAINFSKNIKLDVDTSDFYKVKNVVVVDTRGKTIYNSSLSLELHFSEKTKIYD